VEGIKKSGMGKEMGPGLHPLHRHGYASVQSLTSRAAIRQREENKDVAEDQMLGS
jgi:hypothetical protein